MKSVFVDTSGFHAFLDRDDRFHAEARRLFLQAESEGWSLSTSNYVVHESWALIQARLGWDAVEDFLQELVVRCRVVWVDERLHALGGARARQARDVTCDVGVSRESIYKVLSGNRSPALEKILKVVGGLGLKLHVQAVKS